MKKFSLAAFGITLVLTGIFAFAAPAENTFAATFNEVPDTVLSSSAIALDTNNHIPYIKTDELNRFRPDDFTTRAEAASMLYNLLTDKNSGTASFADVLPDDEYYTEIGAVVYQGLMSGRDDGLFHPDDTLTRGEFAAVICNIFSIKGGSSVFTDLNDTYWEAPYIKAAADYGFMSGYTDGSFLPRKQITRAEAVSVLNRVLNRTPDPNLSSYGDILIMPDVTKSHWAYADICEAVTPHTSSGTDTEIWLSYEPLRLSADYGFITIGCNLYYIDGNTKQYVHDITLGNFTFDENGRYTTGSATLDDCLNSIVGKITNDTMTKEEKLFACYKYIRDNFTYQKGTIYDTGSSGWDVAEAEKLFTKGKGNCYSFASGFTHLARKIGYDAVPIAGKVPSRSGPTAHGWTEIAIDGVTYVFDPELAMANGYDLFKKTYSQTPFTYYK